ncbi:hypothetical protein FRX31_007621 [Thalictrum thalictroides]|uniref:Uncharacterized protein n=1 Tax=Thalictrum thalictroides TaxID=46969 RepID=A0A7J6X0D1_THATH|nr:hypothetical protein FRX31_007621 [Thalictrum thalictroides]
MDIVAEDRPTEMGGLGLRPLAMTLKAFRMKATWNILNADTLWASFMRAKYIKGKNLKTINLIASTSKSWRDSWFCIQELVELSTWEFGPGDLSVITENWRGSGSLIHVEGSMDYAHITLKEAALVQFNIPPFSQDLQKDLWEDFHLKKRHNSQDRRIWPFSSNGDFSIKSYITEVTESNGDLPSMMVSAEMMDVQPPSSTSRIERAHINLPGPPCRTDDDCEYLCGRNKKCAFDHCYCSPP